MSLFEFAVRTWFASIVLMIGIAIADATDKPSFTKLNFIDKLMVIVLSIFAISLITIIYTIPPVK